MKNTDINSYHNQFLSNEKLIINMGSNISLNQLYPPLIERCTINSNSVFKNNDMYKGGWGGQGLLVNPEHDLVTVYTGYFKKDQSEVRLLGMLRTILDELYGVAE